jgi:hypothetical protein
MKRFGDVRVVTPTLVAAMILLLVACSTDPAVAGWRGRDVHLVDGTWIGTETSCADGDVGLECRTIIEVTLQALAPDVRSRTARAVLADLPTTYVMSTGEQRTARLAAGISTRKAVIIDLVDGSRRVVGLWCHLPYSGSDNRLIVRDVTCGIDPLEYWRDGNAPPSFPPGTTFGRAGPVRLVSPAG